MWIEFYWRCQCPKCKTKNWVYHTHSDRAYPLTDIFAVKCYNCGEISWIDDESKEMAGIQHGETMSLEELATLGKQNIR